MRLLYFYLTLVAAASRTVRTLVLEAESGLFSTEGENPIPRSAASGASTVRLSQGDFLQNTFTTPSTCLVAVSSVAYTNDGGSDLIRVSLDGELVGEFNTLDHSSSGAFWNVVVNTGSIGEALEVQEGSHTLRIEAIETDMYNVEIDATTVTFNCTGEVQRLTCYEPDPIDPAPPLCDSYSTVVQRSVETECAEEDNINVPMYYQQVQEFNVTATLPSYVNITDMNDRSPNFTDCAFLNRTLWQVGNHTPSEFAPSPCSSVGSVFYIGQPWTALCEEIDSQNRSLQEFVFSANGTSEGSIAASIGSRLTLAFREVIGTVVIEASYYGRAEQWIELGGKSFVSSQLVQAWTIPDLSWKAGDNVNRIAFQVTRNSTAHAVAFYDHIIMEMRNESGETTTQIYNDGYTIVEVVHIDFWWLYPLTITVQLGSQDWVNVSYFRLYQKVPGPSNSFAQVFVLYQDGNARILTFPPRGIDWIPFGSSVIIGQTDPALPRPYASISRVVIDPSTLTLGVLYENGGQAVLTVKAVEGSTTVTVSSISYNTNNSLPVMTFRSMWVADGNADVDHVSTPEGVWPILTGWENLTSPYVLFFRACISRHNTLSPDIRVDVKCYNATPMFTSTPSNSPPVQPTHSTQLSTGPGVHSTTPNVTRVFSTMHANVYTPPPVKTTPPQSSAQPLPTQMPRATDSPCDQQMNRECVFKGAAIQPLQTTGITLVLLSAWLVIH